MTHTIFGGALSSNKQSATEDELLQAELGGSAASSTDPCCNIPLSCLPGGLERAGAGGLEGWRAAVSLEGWQAGGLEGWRPGGLEAGGRRAGGLLEGWRAVV